MVGTYQQKSLIAIVLLCTKTIEVLFSVGIKPPQNCFVALSLSFVCTLNVTFLPRQIRSWACAVLITQQSSLLEHVGDDRFLDTAPLADSKKVALHNADSFFSKDFSTLVILPLNSEYYLKWTVMALMLRGCKYFVVPPGIIAGIGVCHLDGCFHRIRCMGPHADQNKQCLFLWENPSIRFP